MLTIKRTDEFNVSEHLDSEQAMSEYVNAVVEGGDMALLAAALGDLAKARGMAEIALGLRLTVQPVG